MLDTVPERLELAAVKHSLARANRTALVGVLDLQTSHEFTQKLGDIHALLNKFVG
ncbi:MAG: hypothetical protein OXL95_10675 [Nitrospira sp.]|nr:hypothetical protein [Nitrospira sp.]